MGQVTDAQISRDAIERLYIGMRYLYYRGKYRPTGATGKSIRRLLLQLEPEIYGSIANPEKVELNGLMYVLDRLPKGIVQCPYIYLTADEGYEKSGFQVIIPKKRRRRCFRIDEDQMNIEITRGRSEIYDILTHLTFLYNEADKIRNRAFDKHTHKMDRVWEKIQSVATNQQEKPLSRKDRDIALMHLANILGRTFEETNHAYKHFSEPDDKDRFFKIIYWLGTVSDDDFRNNKRREIVFTSTLRNFIGHHIIGEKWANQIKQVLLDNGLINKNLHIISANMHSVMNMLYAHSATNTKFDLKTHLELYKELSTEKNSTLRQTVKKHALNNGLIQIEDQTGANVNVQIFDLQQWNCTETCFAKNLNNKNDVLIVMDYAFGEQAFELMDELLKPYTHKNKEYKMGVKSVSIMGKAGILDGKKGDIMIPNSHVFEGTTDNYPFANELKINDFKGLRLGVVEGSMLSVLGTSLQNKYLLRYFKESSWHSIGLEMEGAHYQKAIQVASKIRKHINPDVKTLYAYYASDNPLETGSTLASGGLGLTGVKPTYAITQIILQYILSI